MARPALTRQGVIGALGVLLLAVALLGSATPAAAAPAPEVPMFTTATTSWLWSDPTPQGNSLDAVAFAGEEGFAAGQEGTILKSSDGGASWSPLTSGATTELTMLEVTGPGTVIAGGECTLRESADGGASFTRLAVNPSDTTCPEILESFSFLDSREGFVETRERSAASEKDTLLWTANGGASFEARTAVPLFGAKPGKILFRSASEGFALVRGENIGRVMRTTDGGRTWSIAAEVRHQLTNLTFASPMVGYALGQEDTLLRTEDGGATWKMIPLTLPAGTPPSELTSISCGTSEACLITTSHYGPGPDPVLRTVNGGATVALVSPLAGDGAETETLGTAYVTPERVVAVGVGGTSAVSLDGGASFAADAYRSVPVVSQPYEEPPAHIRLGHSPREAFFPGEYGRIDATSDGGKSWRLLRLPTLRAVLDVAFPTPRVGFAVVKGGDAYSTLDGGHTWRRCGDAAVSPGALLAPNGRVVLITGQHGLWRSTNGCRSFTHLSGDVALGARRTALRRIELYGPGAGELIGSRTMIVYARDALLLSTDAGAHWSAPRAPCTLGEIESVSFITARRGYSICNGALFFTRDGGRLWHKILTVAPEENPEFPVVSFTSVRDGFIATRSKSEDRSPGVVFRTEDAGRTWIPEQLPSRIEALIAAPGIAYAVGGFSSIFITHDGGFTGRPTRITIHLVGASSRTRRSLAQLDGEVTVQGQILPAVGGVTVTVARHSGREGWEEETTTTNSEGRFSHTFDSVESTSFIDAYWKGSPGYRGAATGPAKVFVTP